MNASISWNANTEPDLAKYRVYVGTEPGVYSSNSDVDAPATETTLTNLPDGKQVYIAISAIDAGANESAKSSPITLINPYIVFAH